MPTDLHKDGVNLIGLQGIHLSSPSLHSYADIVHRDVADECTAMNVNVKIGGVSDELWKGQTPYRSPYKLSRTIFAQYR